MTPAAKSIYYFGFYLYLIGIVLIAVPNFLLSTIQVPETNEVWIRVVGVLAICLGYYYHRSGAVNDIAFCRLTIPTRIFVFLSFLTFALAEYVSPVIIVFGVVDVAGAVWTWTSLRKEAVVQSATV
jgi:hypothetical protein